jgi:hypothetical protein
VPDAWQAPLLRPRLGDDAACDGSRVSSNTGGRGADIVMEFTGHPGAFNEGLELIRRGRRYVVVGQLGSGTTTIKPSLLVSKQLRILGALSGRAKAYWKALAFLSAHQKHIPFERMISHRYSLDEANTAIHRMKDYEEIKPISGRSEREKTQLMATPLVDRDGPACVDDCVRSSRRRRPEQECGTRWCRGRRSLWNPSSLQTQRRADVVDLSSIFFFAMCHVGSLHSVQLAPLNIAAAF